MPKDDASRGDMAARGHVQPGDPAQAAPANIITPSSADNTFPNDPTVANMNDLLGPVRPLLVRLKKATPDTMPPPHIMVKARTHIELLTTLLVIIGAHIVDEMRTRADGPAVEMRIWYERWRPHFQ